MRATELLEARHRRGHTVWLRFRDGTAGEIDLKQELRGHVFLPLRDPEVFRRFYVHPEGRTLAWTNGADFAPEFLHARTRLVGRNGPLRRHLRQWNAWTRALTVTLWRGHPATVRAMPEISRFFGIQILMWFHEHEPPHFHAIYAGSRSCVIIETGEARGSLPPRAQRLVRDWADLHRGELRENWQRARRAEPLRPIAPLE